MNTTDTREKLATLFARLVDPATDDLEAMSACIWFRKHRFDRADVYAGLGLPLPVEALTPATAPTPAADDGPRWPFKKKHAGESIAHIARTDPDYLRYFLTLTGDKALREPLASQVKAALTALLK